MTNEQQVDRDNRYYDHRDDVDKAIKETTHRHTKASTRLDTVETILGRNELPAKKREEAEAIREDEREQVTFTLKELLELEEERYNLHREWLQQKLEDLQAKA